MRTVASGLNRLSGGRISPNAVTSTGVLLHLPIACLIAVGWLWPAGILLIIFGLFDALDGELARQTGKVSSFGMVLDASSDRIKETFLYSGAVYCFASDGEVIGALMASLALGASISVSYVKARGEIAVATRPKAKFDHQTLNKKLFPAGFLPFEIRMVLLAVGLIVGGLVWPPAIVLAVSVIAIGSFITFIERLINIARFL
jgi:CDP-diacylglycerol--glycerol-3-phosphate 3-phosphatidyltransferase